jgi:transcriptional regulator with XRE-family HTH domain
MAKQKNPLNPPFATMVREARLSQGQSQRQLGEKLKTTQRPRGVYNTYVGQIEKGEKVPSLDVCVKLAEVLELDVNELLLAAYEARTESAESDDARLLFSNMRRALTDPLIKALLAEDKGFDANVLKALTDPGIRGALSDERWQQAISQCYASQKNRDIARLLAFVQVMNDRQWNGIMAMLEGMGLDVTD